MPKLNTSGAFEFRCAYRWPDGQVEGFVGTSLTGAAAARQDAIEQITRKMVHVNHARRYRKEPEIVFDPAQFITSVKNLTVAERELIETDWRTNVRY